MVQTVGLQAGPMWFNFFQIIQNPLKIEKSKWMPYIAQKIPNFGWC
jgi:hypothetical protein